MSETYIDFPLTDKKIRGGQRAYVRYWRSQAAYKLAERKTGKGKVTQEENDAAASLLASIIRWVLANARWAEEDNDSSRYNEARQEATAKRLNRRLKNLRERLSTYHCDLIFPGLYPEIIDDDGHDLRLLYYFE